MKPPEAPMSARVAMRLRVITILKEMKDKGTSMSNYQVAIKAGCSEKLVRNVKSKYMGDMVPGKILIPEDKPRSGRPRTYNDRSV